MFGVEAIEQRTVIDRNRITGGGITAGIDFGLMLTALTGGENIAKTVQLLLEYSPEPPFESGLPKTAEQHILEMAMGITQPLFESRLEIVRKITGA
jgi:cyclohexyl-isocyanide hydratase